MCSGKDIHESAKLSIEINIEMVKTKCKGRCKS